MSIPPKCLECPNGDLCFEEMMESLEEKYLDELFSLMSFSELLKRSEETVYGLYA